MLYGFFMKHRRAGTPDPEVSGYNITSDPTRTKYNCEKRSKDADHSIQH
jgi:hypothetical protein